MPTDINELRKEAERLTTHAENSTSRTERIIIQDDVDRILTGIMDIESEALMHAALHDARLKTETETKTTRL